MNISLETFRIILYVMAALAVVVFFALYQVKAGYGILFDKSWGITLSNKWAWMIMEAPVFIAMCWFWMMSPRKWDLVPFIFFLLFQIHYLQRAFIFPWLIKGKSRMPLLIMFTGIVFNLANAFIQGQWIFFLAPTSMYTQSWIRDPRFLLGTALFLAGLIINIQSDGIIRNLRKDGDSNHYLPEKGLFRYVWNGWVLPYSPGLSADSFSSSGLLPILFHGRTPSTRNTRTNFPMKWPAIPANAYSPLFISSI